MTSREGLIGFGALAAAALAAPPSAEAGDAAAGKALAERWCASCHHVGADSQAMASDAAPSFKDVANRPATTEEGLATYLADPHKDAMKGIVLPRFEIANLAAYIISLRSP